MSGVNKGLTMWNNNTNQPRKRRNVNNTFSKFNVELAEAGFRSTALQYHAVLLFWLLHTVRFMEGPSSAVLSSTRAPEIFCNHHHTIATGCFI